MSGTGPSDSGTQTRYVDRTEFKVGLFIVAVLVGAILWIIVKRLLDTKADALPDEVSLLLWLVVGSAILLALLLSFSLVSRMIDGESEQKVTRGALSLPEGSISAVIALMLLLVFAISSIFLYSQISDRETTGQVSMGITQEALATIPSDRIISLEVADPDEPTYNVTLVPASSASTDFAKTTQTTVATLLVAIVGFYFGQRATASGVAAGKESSAQQITSQTATVPDVTGKDRATAQAHLASAGLKVGTVTDKSTDDKEQVGKVLAQDQPAGGSVPRDTLVNLTVGVQSPASASDPGTVSAITGMDSATAPATAASADLKEGAVTSQPLGLGASSDPIELPAIDTPPKSGAFVDIEGQPLTAAEREEGNRLGQEIDIDDDNDNGLKP